jgi:hypothetical protein
MCQPKKTHTFPKLFFLKSGIGFLIGSSYYQESNQSQQLRWSHAITHA